MGIFKKFVKNAAFAPEAAMQLMSKARGPLIGAGAGAAGMYGLSRLGEKEIRKREEAEELRQLLEEYPELMLSTPTPFDTPEG